MLVLALLLALPAQAADPDSAKTLATQAQVELEAHHAATAATLFDQAHALDDHPLWLVAAADAWLEALDCEQADSRLSDALADPRLVDPARARASERQLLAKRMAPLMQVARKATRDGEHQRAMQHWQEAFALYPLGHLQLEAARSAQRAKRHETRALFEALVTRTDLSLEDQVEVADTLARLQPVLVTPKPLEVDRTIPWVLTVSGAVLVAGGIVMLAIAHDQHDQVEDALGQTDAGLVTAMTRAEAQDHQQTAESLQLAAFITGAIGLGLSGTGVTLMLTETPPTTRTTIPDGWQLRATIGF